MQNLKMDNTVKKNKSFYHVKIDDYKNYVEENCSFLRLNNQGKKTNLKELRELVVDMLAEYIRTNIKGKITKENVNQQKTNVLKDARDKWTESITSLGTEYFEKKNIEGHTYSVIHWKKLKNENLQLYKKMTNKNHLYRTLKVDVVRAGGKVKLEMNDGVGSRAMSGRNSSVNYQSNEYKFPALRHVFSL